MDSMIKCLGFAWNHTMLVEKWQWVANYCRMVISPWRIVVLVSHLGVYLKFSIIIIIKKGDFESGFNERTFCSPLDGKWSAEGGLRALNEFAEDQLSGLECFVGQAFQGPRSHWLVFKLWFEIHLEAGFSAWRMELLKMSPRASKRQEHRLPGRGETRSKSGSALAKWPQITGFFCSLWWISCWKVQLGPRPQLHFN